MASIVVDFGSSNTGACINFFNRENYDRSKIAFVHSNPITRIAKDSTSFWIHKNLLNKRYDSIKDSDFRILSNNFSETENPNIIWTRDQIKRNINTTLKDKTNWVNFQHFKMNLYENKGKVKGSDNIEYRLDVIIKVFLRIIKLECIQYIHKKEITLNENDIQWGVTIPAVWEDPQKDIMRNITQTIFSAKAILLSEPEGALIGLAIHGKNELEYCADRKTLAIDAGGGTTDFVIVTEKEVAPGVFKYIEIKEAMGRAVGGNEIDNNFWSFFTTILAASDLDVSSSKKIVPVEKLWEEFKTEKPSEAMDMEDEWFKIKHSDEKLYSKDKNETLSFRITSGYWQWLIAQGYKSICDKIQLGLGTVELPKSELYENVFAPIFHSISQSVSQVIADSQHPIDIVALAGGLSCSMDLQDEIKRIVRDKHPNVHPVIPGGLWASGAIIYGATHILSKGDKLINRIARKTFLTDCSMDFNKDKKQTLQDLKDKLIDRYHKLGKDILPEQLDECIKKQEHLFKIESNGKVSYLFPLCIKGMPAYNKHESYFIPCIKEQTGVKFLIYSTLNDLVIFPSDNLSGLKLEEEIEYEFGRSWESVSIEINFNSSPIQGVAKFALKENEVIITDKDISNVTLRGL